MPQNPQRGLLLCAIPILITFAFGDDFTSKLNSKSWRANGYVVIILVLTLLICIRKHIMGRVASQVISICGGKDIHRIHIHKMSFKPLQLFQVELVMRDGLKIQVSRVQIDIEPKTFFASLGQGKLVQISVDDVVVENVLKKVTQKQDATLSPEEPIQADPASRKCVISFSTRLT